MCSGNGCVELFNCRCALLFGKGIDQGELLFGPRDERFGVGNPKCAGECGGALFDSAVAVGSPACVKICLHDGKGRAPRVAEIGPNLVLLSFVLVESLVESLARFLARVNRVTHKICQAVIQHGLVKSVDNLSKQLITRGDTQICQRLGDERLLHERGVRGQRGRCRKAHREGAHAQSQPDRDDCLALAHVVSSARRASFFPLYM